MIFKFNKSHRTDLKSILRAVNSEVWCTHIFLDKHPSMLRVFKNNFTSVRNTRNMRNFITF
jgi:hypothetical protein